MIPDDLRAVNRAAIADSLDSDYQAYSRSWRYTELLRWNQAVTRWRRLALVSVPFAAAGWIATFLLWVTR